MGSVTTFDDADMNSLLMPFEADVDEFVVVVTLGREEAELTKPLMPFLRQR